MNICTIITCFSPSVDYGGPVFSTYQRILELINQGNNVTVLTSNIINLKDNITIAPGEYYSNNFRIIRFPSFAPVKHFSSIISIDILRWIIDHYAEFDIFHISFPRELIPISTAFLLSLLNSSYVVQTHGMLNNDNNKIKKIIDKFVTKPLLSKAKGVIVLQEEEEDKIRNIAPRSRSYIIPNGINTTQNYPGWNGVLTNKRKILFLSRLHPRKRVLTFIESAELLLCNVLVDKKILDNLEFVIAGSDGGDYYNAQKAIISKGLSERMHLLGELNHDDAIRELASSYIHVLPSLDEPFATSLTEALLVGTPTIVNTTLQNLPLIKKYDAAEICETSAESLTESISKLLKNPQLCLKYSQNGKALVNNELDISKTVKQLVNIYQQ